MRKAVSWRRELRGAAERVPTRAPLRHLRAVSAGRYRVIVIGLLLATSCLYTLYALAYPLGAITRPEAGTFPLIIGTALTIAVLVVLVRDAAGPNESTLLADDDDVASEPAGVGGEVRVLLFLLNLVLYVLLLDTAGQFIASFVVVLVVLLLARSRPPWQQALFAISMMIGSYLIFEVLLNVPLPQGFTF